MEAAVGLGFINNLTTAYGVKGWNTTFAQAHPHTHLSVAYVYRETDLCYPMFSHDN